MPGCGGMYGGRGTNLSQPLGDVPPGVPTEPVRTLRKNRQRAVCQPPITPADAARQLWAARAPCRPGRSRRRPPPICAAGTPRLALGVLERVAVVQALRARRRTTRRWARRSGRSARRYSSQLTQRRTKSRSNRPRHDELAGDRQEEGRLAARARRPASGRPAQAVFERRGSTTMSFAPLRRPSMIRWACGLK